MWSSVKRLMAPAVKGLARAGGYEPWPLAQHPIHTWLGLKNLPVRTILDIGAYNGHLARDRYQPAFPGAVIHCFEPSPRLFPVLEQTAAASAGRIHAHHFGLGDADGELSFNMSVEADSASSLLPSTEDCERLFPWTAATETATVRIRTLDAALRDLAIPVEDDLLVKVDVQGFEDRVIRGGQDTFRRARAVVLEVQVVEFYKGQPSFKDLFLALDALGLEFIGTLEQAQGPDGSALFFDAVFLRRG